MLVAAVNKVRMDLITDDYNVILKTDLSYLHELFPGPYTADRIMRIAEDQHLNVILADLVLKIFEIDLKARSVADQIRYNKIPATALYGSANRSVERLEDQKAVIFPGKSKYGIRYTEDNAGKL